MCVCVWTPAISEKNHKRERQKFYIKNYKKTTNFVVVLLNGLHPSEFIVQQKLFLSLRSRKI